MNSPLPVHFSVPINSFFNSSESTGPSSSKYKLRLIVSSLVGSDFNFQFPKFLPITALLEPYNEILEFSSPNFTGLLISEIGSGLSYKRPIT